MPEVAQEIVVSDSGYTFPVVDLLTGRGAIFGKSGSGKSNSTTVIAEELLALSLPLLIVDQDGEYHGLAEQYDVLHVGADADCDETVDADDGEDIADRALDTNKPVILDVSGFMEEKTARDLVYNVVRQLFARENDVQKPFLLIVEEVHEYVPEQGGLDELGKMLIRVAKRGRKRGLGICGISQRPASVDKNFITQCDWMVWHRLTWQNDTKVVGKILGSEYADRVQELSNGEGYVMTDWTEEVRRVRFRLKRTTDAGATPGLDQFEDVALAPSHGDGLDDGLSQGFDGHEVRTGFDSRAIPPQDDDVHESSDTVIRPIDEEPPPMSDSGVDPQAQPRRRPSYPGVVTDEDTVHRGNPVWELGQMFAYLFATLVYWVANVFRWIIPSVKPRRRGAHPFGFPQRDSIDWKLTALVLVGINLLLLLGVGYVLLFVLG